MDRWVVGGAGAGCAQALLGLSVLEAQTIDFIVVGQVQVADMSTSFNDPPSISPAFLMRYRTVLGCT